METERIPILQLDWNNDEARVTVTPRDQDRYVVRMRTAVERLQSAKHVESVNEKLSFLQKLLAQWLRGREEVRTAYLTFRDGAFLFVVVTQASEYNAEFEDELTELDIQLATDVDLSPISVNVLALPNAPDSAIDTFLDPAITFGFAPRENRDAD